MPNGYYETMDSYKYTVNHCPDSTLIDRQIFFRIVERRLRTIEKKECDRDYIKITVLKH